MLCKHGNIAPCVKCDIGPLEAENETLRTMMAELVGALGRISNMDSMSYHSLESAKIVAIAALTTYHEQGDQL